MREARVRPAHRLALLVLLGCWCSLPLAADSYPRQPGVDVRNYVFRLELRDGSRAIAGETDVDVTFTADGVRDLFLDLVGPSADGKTGMTVASVTAAGQPLVFTHDANRLRIALDRPSTAGERRTFSVRYSGVPADGLIIGTNKFADTVFFGDNFPDRCRYWLPTVDHPHDKASCEFVVTAPDTYQVVGPGAMVETTDLPGGRRLTRYRETAAVPTYCMVIGVARFAVQVVGEVDHVPVQSWVYAQQRDPGFADFRIAMKPMELFTWRIGRFSYEKLANVQSKTRYGGMENASAIFYREGVVTGKGTNENLFAHEIAHQWFGDSVTESDWDDTWLSEGFATYLTHVYEEYTAGRDAMVQGLRRDREAVVRYYAKNPKAAVVSPATPTLDNILTTNTYQKGGWVLHMLRRAVGDEMFWRGVGTYYQRFRNGNALTADFERVMEEVSGKALGPFFQQWVYTPGQPLLTGTWAWADGQLTVDLHQAQTTGPVWVAPLDIGIVTERSAPARVETVPLERRDQAFTFKVDREPADVVLDPNVWLLMQAGPFTRKTPSAGGR